MRSAPDPPLFIHNANQAKGSFNGPMQTYQIGANDQLLDSNGYANSVIAYRNNAPVRLSDVATVINDVEWLQERHDWPGLKAVVMVESSREANEKNRA